MAKKILDFYIVRNTRIPQDRVKMVLSENLKFKRRIYEKSKMYFVFYFYGLVYFFLSI